MAGKGSKPRPTDKTTYDNNFDQINWRSKKKDDKPMNEDQQKPDLLSMSEDEFDKYMCEKYPKLFVQRHMPMNQTCMCWGFDIFRGWYPILDELCQRLQLLCDLTGRIAVFHQVKEKYGSARFYVGVEHDKDGGLDHTVSSELISIVDDIIYSVVDNSERKTEKTCEHCGEQYYHHRIVLGGWYYALCKKCFLEKYPDRKEDLKLLEEQQEFQHKLVYYMYTYTDDEIAQLKKIVDNAEERLKKINNG